MDTKAADVGADSKETSKGEMAKMLADPAAFARALGEIDEQDVEVFLKDLPLNVRRRIQALKKLQHKSLEVEAAFYARVHQLECEFAKDFDAIHAKRRDIVNGSHEPSKEEADYPLIGAPKLEVKKELEEKAKVENGEGEHNGDDGEKMEESKGIPDFWLTLLQNVELMDDMIQEADVEILKHLTDVECQMTESPMAFQILFHFSPNEYFSNTCLSKKYSLKCTLDPEDPFEFDGPEIITSDGCKIEWKAGKNVTVKQVKKKQKHKAKGNTRFVTKEVKADSFFNFFDPPKVDPGTPFVDLDEDTRELLNADFEIGQVLRDRVIPRAVLYFTGEAHDEDSLDEEEDEDLDDDDLDEDDESEEDK